MEGPNLSDISDPFGPGGGFGGGGGKGGRRLIPKLFGPKGSGAIITPGENWPFTPGNLIKNRWILIPTVGILILAAASKK